MTTYKTTQKQNIDGYVIPAGTQVGRGDAEQFRPVDEYPRIGWGHVAPRLHAGLIAASSDVQSSTPKRGRPKKKASGK